MQTYEKGMMGRGYCKWGSPLATQDPTISLSRLFQHIAIQVEIIPGTLNHIALMPSRSRDHSNTLARSSVKNTLHITTAKINEVLKKGEPRDRDT